MTQADEATQPSGPNGTDRRSFMRTGALSIGALGGLFSGLPLSAEQTPIWGLRPPFEIKAFESNTAKIPGGTEFTHRIEETGAGGIRAISTGVYKHRDSGASYNIFSYVGVQYFKGASPKPRAYARYGLVIVGTKGEVSGRKRIGDKLDMMFLADGRLVAKVQRTVDVQLDNPFEGMSDKDIYHELRARRTAKLGMETFLPTQGGTQK